MLTVLVGWFIQFLSKNLLTYHRCLNIRENRTGQYLWNLQRLGFPVVVFSTHRWPNDECLREEFWWRGFGVLMIYVLFLLAVHAFLDTMHEQLAVNTQPYSFCRHTHTLYIVEDSLCLWLGSTLKFEKVNSRPEFLNVYHKFINTKEYPLKVQNFRFLESVPAKVSVLRP